MIQANEAVVGRWFNRKHGKGHTWTQLTEDMMCWIFHPEMMEYALDDFEPIPLTPEILEKAGFEKLKKADTYRCYWGSLDKVLFIGFYGTGIFPTIVKEGEMVSDPTGAIMLNKIEYLHQLQNLIFALTGQELTINL